MSEEIQQTLDNGSVSDGWKQPDKLRELYVERGLSTYKIAQLHDVSRNKVRYRLQKHGIFRPNQLEEYPNENKLKRVYQDAGTVKKAIEQLDISRGMVLRLMNHYEIIREKGVNYSAPCPFQTNTNGYEVWGHPNSKKYDGATVLVHRLVKLAEVGFDALKDRDVHHRNTIKWDNRPSNLELIDRGEHTRRHKEGVPISVELANMDESGVVEALHTAGYSSILNDS